MSGLRVFILSPAVPPAKSFYLLSFPVPVGWAGSCSGHRGTAGFREWGERGGLACGWEGGKTLGSGTMT